ncbi:MAG: phage terminase large subunit [Candidatus Fimivivens sp.]
MGANLELARRDLFVYCNLRAPDFYQADRPFLIQVCQELQDFYEAPDERVMIVALPPRHGKSRTAGLLTQWIFGKRPTEKVMTGSYNTTLSTTFSKTVRNGIQETKVDRSKIVYSDIFPDTRIQRGDGAMNLWALEGQYASYLATSPDGTATGFGGSLMIIDDLIKNAMEAFNDNTLEELWKWFTDTMLSRLEEGGKIIIIMTRWASKDLAGRAIDYFEGIGVPVRKLILKALQDDGSMLCPQILSRESYDMKIGAMSEEIASANYQQIPIDLKGRLYSTLKTYTALPEDERGKILSRGVYNYTDTADTGDDYLCSIDYHDIGGEAYIIDVVYTQAAMEKTEPAVADMLDTDAVNVADIESNNGGRGFARNVTDRLRKKGNRRCVVKWFHQSQNKKSRILTNATWVMEHVYFPANWRDRWPEFYKAMISYQKSGKNAHDDAPDAVTGIAEHFVKPQKRIKIGKRRYGL